MSELLRLYRQEDSFPEGKCVLTPDQIAQELPFGFHGKPADAIYIVSGVSGVANGGPLTQTREVIKGARLMTEGKGISFGVVIPRGEQEKYGVKSSACLEITPGDTVSDRYRIAKEAMKQLLTLAIDQGQKRIVIVTNGYTGYLPWGVKEGMRALRDQGKGNDMVVHVVIQDSCFPDTDHPSDAYDEYGFPIDRFAPSAYKSDANLGVRVFMMINNWLPVDPRDSMHRTPEGVYGMAASFPFTEDYLNFWLESLMYDKAEARKEIANTFSSCYPILSELLINPQTIFIPLIASQGYWDPNNVGMWMTKEQHEDMIRGSRLLVESAKIVAQQIGRPVLLTGARGFVDVARKVKDVFVESIPLSQKGGYVVVYSVPFMDPSVYRIFARAADMHVHRTSQANSMPEMMATGVPALLLSMPQEGYMSVETMDPLFGRIREASGDVSIGPYHTTKNSAQELANSMMNVLLRPFIAREQVLRQAIAYGMTHFDGRRNFYSLLQHIAGIKKIPS